MSSQVDLERMTARLLELSSRCEARTATASERLEWAELSVAAKDAARAAGDDMAKRLAAEYFVQLASTYGDEAARAAWTLAPPKRSRGYHMSDADRRREAVIVATDQTYRELGEEREEAAARSLEDAGVSLGADLNPHDARRTVDRMKARRKPKA